MGLDNRNGAEPHTSFGTWSLPHTVAMVTIVMFSVRHVLNQQFSMDRPQQLSIRQKISTFLSPLDIYYKDNVTDEVKSTKFLGMHINNHMNWKNHADQIIPKFSAACFSISNLINILNPNILCMVYFVYTSFSTSVWNNLLGKFNTSASSI